MNVVFFFCFLLAIFASSTAQRVPESPPSNIDPSKAVSCCENRKSYNWCPRLCPDAYKAFGLTEAPFIPLPPFVVDPKEAAGIGELNAPWKPLIEN